MNWRAKPLTTYRTIIELIAATTTKSGLRIEADLDTRSYPIGVKVTDKQLAHSRCADTTGSPSGTTQSNPHNRSRYATAARSRWRCS